MNTENYLKLLRCSRCFGQITKIFNNCLFLSFITFQKLLKIQAPYKLEWRLKMDQTMVYYMGYLILNIIMYS